MALAFIVIAVHLLLTSVLFALLGGFWLFRLVRLLRLRKHGSRAEGVIVSVPKRAAQGGAAGEAPLGERSGGKERTVLSFEAAGGRTIEAKPGLALAFAKGQPGQQVTVVYDPADPFRTDIVEWKARIRSYQLVIGFVAVVCVLLSGASIGLF